MGRKPKAATDTKNLIKRGSVWYVKRMVNGELIVQTTGKTKLTEAYDERNRILNSTYLRDEKERAEAVLARVATLDQRLDKIVEERPALGVDVAWAAYRNAPNRPDSGPRTLDGYASQFARFTDWLALKHPDVTELRGVTEEIAFEFAGELGRTLTPNSYNKYLVLFRRLWKVLYKTGGLKGNPWADLENKLLATHSRRELTLEELSKVCAAVDGEMRLLFAVGLYCGLRLGDAVLLKWSNVDLMRRVAMIVPQKTARRSNGKVLKIPLHPALLVMLNEVHGNGDGYVMPGLAELYLRDDTALVKRIQAVFEECKIATRCCVKGYSRQGVDVGFHSLRHSFVSLSANAGASLAAVQAVVGHSNPAMTRHYLHADQNVVRNAVGLLPYVAHSGGKKMGADAAGAKLEGVLAGLEGLSKEELKKVGERVKEMLG